MDPSANQAARTPPPLPRVDVYHGANGVPVVDVDTADDADAIDAAGAPFLRVAVNDGYVYERNPPQPFRGSRDALGLDCETGPNDEHHCTLRPGETEDALQIAACIGMQPLVDPGWYWHLQQRGLIAVQIGPGAHKYAAATTLGDAILRRALPHRGRLYPEV